MVLSIEEKSHIQTLDRTQPGLPLKRGRCGTTTHNYRRHGTTTLFAALGVLDGEIIGVACSVLKRGTFRSIVQLQEAIDRFVAEANDDPRPFRWTKEPDTIIAAVRRWHQVLDPVH